MISLIPLPYKLLALGLAIAAIIGSVLGYGHREYVKGVQTTTLSYESALSKQKAEASTTLNAETTKVLIVERALQAAKNLQETQDADHQKTVLDMSERLRRAAGVAVRLRDPNAPPGCRLGSSSPTRSTTATTGASDSNNTETGGLLSKQLTEFLLNQARDADEVNNAFASCKAYASKVSENLTQTKE